MSNRTVKKNIPKYNETFKPILEILSNGKVFSVQDVRELIKNKYYSHLPKELLETRKRNSNLLLIYDRIDWGKSYLKQAKLVKYPERGKVQITEKGVDYLQRGDFSLDTLKKDPDFLEHRKRIEKNKKETENINDTAENTPLELIINGITEIENQVKTDLLEKLREINPYYFEKIILILLNRMGYGDFIETPKSNDGGIDGILNQDKLGLRKIYIQAKRYSENKVREKEIRNFIGAMSGDTDMGVFVTTSLFDNSAINKANNARHTIVLIDGDKLVDLMYEYGVGVQIKNVYEEKEIDEDFFISD